MGIFGFFKKKEEDNIDFEQNEQVKDDNEGTNDEIDEGKSAFAPRQEFRPAYEQPDNKLNFPQPQFNDMRNQHSADNMQLVLTKLELINQRLEVIDRRIQEIERIAKEK